MAAARSAQAAGADHGRPQPELILASTSSARRTLMDALGLPYRAQKPDFDEHFRLKDPIDLSHELAWGKAKAVATLNPGALVIGSDQVCGFEGEIWGKPRDLDDAREKLQRLSGKTHQLYTAVALLGPKLERVEHDVVSLTMYALDPNELEGYLATREWEGCAGGYRVEERGMALFSKIDGDLNSVRGLPMTLVVRMLRDAGVRFF
ncbi:MAG: septum formation protein Maf [Deltaproteobacteria bacterium]|nr:septum formation protein Maf [Deltaproteobacteria bacterium]